MFTDEPVSKKLTLNDLNQLEQSSYVPNYSTAMMISNEFAFIQILKLSRQSSHFC